MPRSSKIVVQKLTKNINENHLHEIFGVYGRIEDIDMPLNRAYMTNRGTAYILFHSPLAAEKAIAHMHEGHIDGAQINVSIVLPRRRFSRSPPARRPPPNRFGEPHRFRDSGPYMGPRGGGGGRGGDRYRSPPRRRSPYRPNDRRGRGRDYTPPLRDRSFSPRRSRSRSRSRGCTRQRSDSRSPPRKRRDDRPPRGGRGTGRGSVSSGSFSRSRSRSRDRDRERRR
ncbi:hypothetical protein KVT40_005814 [Elsinoe batatas]|uniref:RRM domain-containing protein n=1 Tax=Elsinoe batatas TaxID=2601811 RepID=A0A8K0KZI5_9PEZI|nr:hypothetical protein KVT40_005814 [Elsinoe batatas]